MINTPLILIFSYYVVDCIRIISVLVIVARNGVFGIVYVAL